MVQLENDGMMYFKPTCVQHCFIAPVCSPQYLTAPCVYKWRIKYSDSVALNVHPMSGTILPYEIQVRNHLALRDTGQEPSGLMRDRSGTILPSEIQVRNHLAFRDTVRNPLAFEIQVRNHLAL